MRAKAPNSQKAQAKTPAHHKLSPAVDILSTVRYSSEVLKYQRVDAFTRHLCARYFSAQGGGDLGLSDRHGRSI